MPARRLWIWVALLLGLAALAAAGAGYRNAIADPLVRTLTLRVPGYPATAAPVRILLFSDVHVHGPDMPPGRVAGIVEQINALHPDIVVAAGDFVGNNRIGRDYSAAEAVAPLGQLKAKYGVFAVLGNNDYIAGADDVARGLKRAGIRLLSDDAMKAGPIALGGIDGRLRSAPVLAAARRRTYAAIRGTPGVPVLIVHRPDEFVRSRRHVVLTLAGHTHCGQIVLPLIGPVETGSDYGPRFLCGLHRNGSSLLVVTAGLGTSYVPLRFGAPPDIWVISIEGAAR
jgi:predicted MPP superfamily phosphohydrolase